MAKIKKTDITKLSKLEQQIEQLKEQKKKQEEQLSKKIGDYFLAELDLDTINSSDELYKIMDKVILEFKETEQDNQDRSDEETTENETSTDEFNQDNNNDFSDEVTE
ncbi:hypothetical protein [Staphylococcus haemolyticus]|uniref:hypothetical protein n=1 Tax=Staphylococcus haemolyticus TaxID=1283 RepID=UPI0025525032|nr:hypothetical protein [Staphylococcus haemolyticus]MDK7236001.1 hypothetical protein [Staphylococcus haemolyticus]